MHEKRSGQVVCTQIQFIEKYIADQTTITLECSLKLKQHYQANKAIVLITKKTDKLGKINLNLC